MSSRSPLPVTLPVRTAMTVVGLRFTDAVTFEEWEALGPRLAHITKATPWWLGDWLFRGETKFRRVDRGRYETAIAATGLDYQTLANYKSVAGRFPLSRRREKLSFAHHEVVAGI